MRPKVLLADEHRVVLEGLRAILERHFDIAGAVTDGAQLVAEARRLRPDVIVTAITIPTLNGIDAAREIRKFDLQVRIIVLTAHADPSFARMAFQAGCSGYVVKHSPSAELLKAIKEVLAGGSFMSPHVGVPSATTLTKSGRKSKTDLSPRQRQVLQLIGEGKSSKEIAGVMRISPKTVEFHKAAVMTKIGARCSADLVKYAVKHGLVG